MTTCLVFQFTIKRKVGYIVVYGALMVKKKLMNISTFMIQKIGIFLEVGDRLRRGKSCLWILLYGFSEAVSAVWNDQGGGAGNHSVIFIKERLQKQSDCWLMLSLVLHTPDKTSKQICLEQ